MAQVKLLKIAADGVPVEFDSSADEITLASVSVTGGPSITSTGIDLNNKDLTETKDILFQDPSTSVINQTSGNLVIDNIMAKERSNALTTAADILFPTVSNTSGEVDALRLPTISGTPSASPTASGEGFPLWDTTNKKLWIWDGSTWDDQSTVQSAQNVEDNYTAEVAVAARDVVALSSADSVSPASASSASLSQALGLALASASLGGSLIVRKSGKVSGFTGLTPAARYYLSTTAGQITPTIPSGAGNTIVQVGYAKNATTLDIQIQSLGRRA